MTRHLLNISDLSVSELRAILDLSLQQSVRDAQPLNGQGVALIFEKPSIERVIQWKWLSFNWAVIPYTRVVKKLVSMCVNL